MLVKPIQKILSETLAEIPALMVLPRAKWVAHGSSLGTTEGNAVMLNCGEHQLRFELWFTDDAGIHREEFLQLMDQLALKWVRPKEIGRCVRSSVEYIAVLGQPDRPQITYFVGQSDNTEQEFVFGELDDFGEPTEQCWQVRLLLE